MSFPFDRLPPASDFDRILIFMLNVVAHKAKIEWSEAWGVERLLHSFMSRLAVWLRSAVWALIQAIACSSNEELSVWGSHRARVHQMLDNGLKKSPNLFWKTWILKDPLYCFNCYSDCWGNQIKHEYRHAHLLGLSCKPVDDLAACGR